MFSTSQNRIEAMIGIPREDHKIAVTIVGHFLLLSNLKDL